MFVFANLGKLDFELPKNHKNLVVKTQKIGHELLWVLGFMSRVCGTRDTPQKCLSGTKITYNFRRKVIFCGVS
jgi:hypothetical protein